MSLLACAFVIAAVLVVVAVVIYRRDRKRRGPRYVETTAWQQEHWQLKHERERALSGACFKEIHEDTRG
jgi:hypothetical protein